ncbi:MAG TPA: hypothetical protein VNS79_09980 [Sphingobium sp.]|nr:hypothetical protein [Sphingobium sp.]
MKSMSSPVSRYGRLRIRRREAHVIRPAAPRPHRRDCQGQLLARLRAMMAPDGTIEQATMRPWCSATFVGTQHRLHLMLEGAQARQRADALAASLGEADFMLNGHIVADVVVDDIRADDKGDTAILLEVLTIEDW